MNGMGGSDGNGAASGTSGIRVEMTEQLGYPMAVLKVPAKKLIATKDAAVPDGGFPDAAVSDGECPDAPVPDGGFPNVSGTVGKVPRPASGSLYHDYVPPVEEDAVLTLIPYYAWANRGEGEMTVWIRV